MTVLERKRLNLLSMAIHNKLSIKEASSMLLLDYRYCRRLVKRLKQEGDSGILDRRRSNGGHSSYSALDKKHILSYYQTHLIGYGPTLASEVLEQEAQLLVKPETLRLWLKQAGLWTRQRKRSPYRSHRERAERFGQMLQLDGSKHRWLGPDKGFSTLMHLVDDATGTSLAVLSKGEDLQGLLSLLWLWFERYGLPQIIYTDKLELYSTKDHTQFKRICETLGIQVIHAHSPQAKGRVERKHALYQDRFVKALRRHNISTLSEANTFLQAGFIDDLNARYAKTPSKPEDAHVSVTPTQLAWVLCVQEQRILNQDYTIRYKKQWIQLAPTPRVRPKQTITISTSIQGKLSLSVGQHPLAYTLIHSNQRSKPMPKSKTKKPPSKPNLNHPWRTFNPDWLKHHA